MIIDKVITDDASTERILACMRSAFAKGEACALNYFREMEQHGSLQVHTKADASPVTLADRETEAAIRAQILADFPKDALLGEEMGATAGCGSEKSNEAANKRICKSTGKSEKAALWVIDPIDGTKAFIIGFPLFGILLARLDRQRELLASGVSMPALGCRRFFATRDGICWEEDKYGDKQQQLTTSGRKNLSLARLCIGEAERTLRQPHLPIARALAEKVASTRYEHDCYMYVRLAGGGIDMLLETGLQPYDFLPLVLLVERAGGVISDWQGAPLTLSSSGQVLACASCELHEQALALIDRQIKINTQK